MLQVIPPKNPALLRETHITTVNGKEVQFYSCPMEASQVYQKNEIVVHDDKMYQSKVDNNAFDVMVKDCWELLCEVEEAIKQRELAWEELKKTVEEWTF